MSTKNEELERYMNAAMAMMREDPERYIPDPEMRRQFIEVNAEADLWFGPGWTLRRRDLENVPDA